MHQATGRPPVARGVRSVIVGASAPLHTAQALNRSVHPWSSPGCGRPNGPVRASAPLRRSAASHNRAAPRLGTRGRPQHSATIF
ncbi:hypothetical protein NDU88_002319 [Pleurodeles waltl]|uniref:Uncharacterized protein n=1 Tax=Pleurodeles waltl TaxID=8319 RepID=A0AAV7VAX3_PLEWA|nr:hypothetical protein NDU88_002319 [Pleurodeles waltl]